MSDQAPFSSIAPAQPNRSLADGMTVLLQLVSAREPVGSRELARELGFEPTRVNRLLGTLAQLGLAARTADRKYAAGPGIHVMAALSLTGSRLLKAARPWMEQLHAGAALTGAAPAAMARTGVGESGAGASDPTGALEVPTAVEAPRGYGVALGVLWRRHVCYLFHGAAGRPMAAGIAGHELYAAERSSIGLALLAGRPAAQVAELFLGSAVDAAALERRLAAARQSGYADNEDGSIAVAIAGPTAGGGTTEQTGPARSTGPAVAGLALIGVTAEDRATQAGRLQHAAAAIAATLNRRGPPEIQTANC